MRVGFFDRVITPPLGYEMPGGFNKRYATGVRDDLRANAIYIENFGTAAVLISVDCVSFDGEFAAIVRGVVQEYARVPARNVLVAATHDHSAGPTADVLMSEKNAVYCKWAAEQAGSAAVGAMQRATEAKVGWETADVSGLGFNRRWFVRGREDVVTNPGRIPFEDRLRPAGPVDEQVIAFGAWDEDGQLLGALVNFTCHTTLMSGQRYSADYPGELRRQLGVPIVYLNGAMGDINQIDFSDPDETSQFFGTDAVKAFGSELADGVHEALGKAPRYTSSLIDAYSEIIELELRSPEKKQLAEARALYENDDAEWDTDRIYARELALLDERIATEGPTTQAEIQALKIGDLRIAATPAQPFCQMGLEIKASQENPTMIVSLANGNVGYVGKREHYAEGGYELTLKRGAALAPGAGEQCVAASIWALDKLMT